MTTEPQIDPTVVYAAAPGLIAEMCWVTEQARERRFGTEPGREFWLRKAALLDRIAIQESTTYSADVAADAVAVAGAAALRLAEYDAGHSGVSLRGLELATGDDCRLYVREQYREWNRTQPH
ncbi:hypothetical protein QCN29_05035 [Streptomyces sp. HNM0663]|uniref:Uncharacterized protein n=1 Tax=Streptomyces chengmaiensis TaxID=3040919 RepID=A0ABT6HHK7_9ACTN|nr:hypothetical protein [Streptomyces chengmaiensis]MDH2388163.1 hypothetical protein [Streptomyces chengmaiensis]